MTATGSTLQSEGLKMLEAFTGIGADRFHVTFTNLREQETDFFKNRTVPSMRYNLAGWMRRAATLKPITLPATETEPEQTILAGENLIIRPYTPPAVVPVQLDDLKPPELARIRPAAFLTLQTSPGNYQAWVAVEGGDKEFSSRLKRGTGADMTASGSVRLAGTANYKRKYKPDFPTVTIDAIQPGHRITRGQLESMGVVAPAPPKPQIQPSPLRCSDRPTRLAWPDYQRCLEEGRESSSGGKQRSAADFTFCCIAIDYFKRTPEETAAKLMELSSKAKENGYAYALDQAMNAAEKVAANPRSRLRN